MLSNLIFFIWCILFLYLTGCSPESPKYWPANGTVFRNITWEIPIADSLHVLVKQGDNWILPEPPKAILPETTLTYHRISELIHYNKELGRVDQEVVNSNAPLQVEFYRFEKGSVQFLGYMNSDTINTLTVYNPPLVIFPSIMETLPFLHESEGTTRIWNAVTNRFKEGYQNRIRLELKESGSVLMDSIVVFGLFCEMTFSSNRTVGFGEMNLIVPDAIQLKSKMVIVEDFGPVLEWGYRSRKIEWSNQEQVLSDEEGMQKELDAHKEFEIYIEVTWHVILHE